MSLEELRHQIDTIDTQIIRLLNERADVVHEIGVIKKRDGLEIYAPEREEKLLRSLVAKGEGGRLPEESIRAIYREIMSAALALEEDLKIAYLGPVGTWTHQAAIGKFGHSVKYLPQTSLSDVFDRVERRVADYGVVPIENSTEGAVSDIYDLFERHSLRICAEVFVPVDICLMAKKDSRDFRLIKGHPANLAAARQWLCSEYPASAQEETLSTFKAVEDARCDESCAAVGGMIAASVSGLEVLAKKIQNEDSIARFSVIGRNSCPPTGGDRTLVIIRGGPMGQALVGTLRVMSSLGIETVRVDGNDSSSGSLVRIEVRGHEQSSPLAEAIKRLGEEGKSVRVMGSYPEQTAPLHGLAEETPDRSHSKSIKIDPSGQE